MLPAMNFDDLSPFEHLRHAATSQPDPQRLLFVFAAAELPGDATPAQRERFAAGAGGALEPLMCVDKAPAELDTFESLVAESRNAGPAWQVVFAAGLSGRNGRAPDAAQIETALHTMVERVRSGRLQGMLALDRTGDSLTFV